MIKILKDRPMLLAAAGMILICLQSYACERSLWVTAVVLAGLFAVGLYRRTRVALLAVTVLLLVGELAAVGNQAKLQRAENLSGQEISMQAVYHSCNYRAGTYMISTVEVMQCSQLPQGTKISLLSDEKDFTPGDGLTLTVKLEKLSGSFRRSTLSQCVSLSGEAKRMVANGQQDKVLRLGERTRNYIRKTLFANLGYPRAATMCALVTGDKSFFSDSFYTRVKSAGVAHVMVVSGMHLSILVSLLLKLCEKILYHPLARASVMVGAVAFMWLICGFSPSILRAGITYFIMAAGLAFGRDYCAENALGAAVTALLIFEPFMVFSAQFQLSCASTFGILGLALPLMRYLKSREWVRSRTAEAVIGSVAISLSAFVCTLPICISLFGYVSVVGIATNLLISLPVTVCLSVCLCALAVSVVFPAAAGVLFAGVDVLAGYINGVINLLGGLSFSTVRLPSYTAVPALGLILVLFWGMCSCKKRLDMIKLKELRRKVLDEGGKRRGSRAGRSVEKESV